MHDPSGCLNLFFKFLFLEYLHDFKSRIKSNAWGSSHSKDQPALQTRHNVEAMKRIRWKIRDLIEEIHNKLALTLCRIFDVI